MKMYSESVTDKTGHILMKTRIETESGQVTERTLSWEDYISLIGGSAKVEEAYTPINPGFMPEGLVSAKVASKDTWKCVWREPAKVRQFVHLSGHYRIPFPDLVFSVQVKKGTVLNKHVFAVKGEQDMLYRYPFGNVSPSSGSICMGNIKIDGLEDHISAFSEEFFFGKTNNDYFHPGSHVKPKFTQEELLRRLDGKSKFPAKWLLPVAAPINTVTQLVQGLDRESTNSWW